jgi:hypothetical protein
MARIAVSMTRYIGTSVIEMQTNRHLQLCSSLSEPCSPIRLQTWSHAIGDTGQSNSSYTVMILESQLAAWNKVQLPNETDHWKHPFLPQVLMGWYLAAFAVPLYRNLVCTTPPMSTNYSSAATSQYAHSILSSMGFTQASLTNVCSSNRSTTKWRKFVWVSGRIGKKTWWLYGLRGVRWWFVSGRIWGNTDSSSRKKLMIWRAPLQWNCIARASDST